MEDEDRPRHTVYDCALGKQIDIEMTDDQWAEHRAERARDTADRAAQATEDARLAALAAAHPDELVQTLARRAGVL